MIVIWLSSLIIGLVLLSPCAFRERDFWLRATRKFLAEPPGERRDRESGRSAWEYRSKFVVGAALHSSPRERQPHRAGMPVKAWIASVIML